MPTYKDINLLSQKSAVAGTEKLPVSDTEYITPTQIVAGVKAQISEDSYLTASLRSKFTLHYTHNGDGTFGQNQARNAITTPQKYDDDVVVSVTSGHKFVVQYFDGYETGSSHLISATGWLTSDYTVPYGSYWTIVVANSDDSTTDESTTNSLYFSGVADGPLIVDRFNGIDADITTMNGRITVIENDIAHTIVKDERISAGDTQQIVRLGALDSGTGVHIQVSNESGYWYTHFYLLYKTTDMSIIQQWSGPFSAEITIADSAEYALYTNIVSGGNLSYDLYIEVIGPLSTQVAENTKDIDALKDQIGDIETLLAAI